MKLFPVLIRIITIEVLFIEETETDSICMERQIVQGGEERIP